MAEHDAGQNKHPGQVALAEPVAQAPEHQLNGEVRLTTLPARRALFGWSSHSVRSQRRRSTASQAGQFMAQ
jgi:hypothetical protein